MKRILLLTAAAVLAFGLITAAVSNSRTDDPLGVAVAPQTLLLGSDQGGSVVVHTAIPYSSVETSSVTLDGLAVKWTKADSCGNLVAYFSEAEVKAMVAPPSAELTLSGLTKDGESFSGSDTVRVVEMDK